MSSLGGSGSGFLMKLWSRCPLKQYASDGWTGIQDLLLIWSAHSWSVSAGCWWKASNLHHVDLSMGLLECPHSMLSGCPG